MLSSILLHRADIVAWTFAVFLQNFPAISKLFLFYPERIFDFVCCSILLSASLGSSTIGLGQNPVSHQLVGHSFSSSKTRHFQSSKRLHPYFLLVQSRSSEFVKTSTATPKPTCEVIGIYNPHPQTTATTN